jgi:nucleotide-binding universal stress UspA family protein
MGLHRRILLATDFSLPSRDAFIAAVNQAREDDAALLMVNVVEPLLMGFNDVASDERLMKRMNEESVELLEYWTAEARQRGVRDVRCLSVEGSAWRQIVGLAEREGVDLIILGTHGRGGLYHLLVGSVAEKVVQHARCSVLVARAPMAAAS